MNTTTDQTFDLQPPAGTKLARELISKNVRVLDAPIRVGPRSTVVLWMPK
jgi:hypothetical protein